LKVKQARRRQPFWRGKFFAFSVMSVLSQLACGGCSLVTKGLVVTVLAGATAAAAGFLADAESATDQFDRGEAVAALPPGLSTTRMRAHLTALQRIADRTGGTRAAGTAGYRASVRYVSDQLRRAGYPPRVVDFPFVEYREIRERVRQVSPRSRALRAEAIDYSPSTPRGGLRGRLVVAQGNGCEPTDFVGVRGAVALAVRGTCFISVKGRNAAAAGARALLVYSAEPGPLDATLGDPRAASIPVAALPTAAGKRLAAEHNAVVKLEIVTRKRASTSQNVIADTRPSSRRVLLVGAHLDSVVAGPGINDNGTGVAALLEIARVLRRVAPELSVRFGFWGAEEYGLIGSRAYAAHANAREIAGYLNFDMLGSPAREYGVYAAGPYTERLLEYLRGAGVRATTVDVEGRSDHYSFDQIGIPTGGVIAGFDPCYHAACDRLGRVDLEPLNTLAAAAAFGIASFAPAEGRNS
jgi:Zn-dependent M28 family amino/carboxypeptidase